MRLLFALILVSLFSCGYQVMHTARLYGHSTIILHTFSEESPLGLSSELGTSLHHKLLNGNLNISHDSDLNFPVLEGTIKEVATRPSSLAGVGSSIPAYQVRLKVAVTLRESSGTVLWKKTFSYSEDYLSPRSNIDNSVLKTEANKRRALKRMAEKIAEEIHKELFLDATLARSTEESS